MNTSLAFEIVLKTITLMFAIGLLGFGILFLEQVDYVDRFIDTMNHKRVIAERRILTAHAKFMVACECLSQRLFYSNGWSTYPDVSLNRLNHEYVVGSQKIVKTSVSVKPKTLNVTLHAFGTRLDTPPSINKHIEPPVEDDVDTIIKRRFGFV